MGPSPCRALAAAMAFASMAILSSAKLVTIDDTDLTQWTYTGQWGTISKEHLCSTCQTQPDPDQVYEGTWHDLTQIGDATLTVNQAKSISIYGICPGPTVDGGSYALNISVYMDGAEVYKFDAPDGGCDDYQYNYLLYENKNLPLKGYAVQILNLIQDTALPDSALLVDYAVIDDGQVESTTVPPSGSLSGTAADPSRTPNPQQSQSSGNSVPIVAVIVPVVVVVVLAVALLAFCLWRKRRRRDDAGQAPVPFATHDLDARPYGGASGYAPSQYTVPPDMRTIASPGYVSGPRSQYGEDTESVYSQPRATAHDPQLEAALAIIADRAARAQAPAAESGPSVPPVPVHSAAYQAAQRPEKSRYRAQQQAPSQTTPTLDRSASVSHSASSGSRGQGTTVESGGDGRMQPPSYVESTVPRRR